jgi:hypothetical protein
MTPPVSVARLSGVTLRYRHRVARAQRNWRVPHGSTPHSGRGTVLLHPSEHRCPILSSLSEPLSKQLVSVLGLLDLQFC